MLKQRFIILGNYGKSDPPRPVLVKVLTELCYNIHRVHGSLKMRTFLSAAFRIAERSAKGSLHLVFYDETVTKFPY